MTKINQDFLMWSGDTKHIVVTVVDGDGDVLNIAGAAISWVLQQNVDSLPLIAKSVDDGIILSDPAHGEFTIALAPANTANLSGRYYHEAEMTDAAGAVSTAMIGHATIRTDAI